MIWFYVWIVVVIITENFPISSSSHLLLFERLMQYSGKENELSFIPPYFDEFLHSVNLIVLALFFWHRWFFALKALRRTYPMVMHSVVKTIVGCLITLAWYGLFATHLIDKTSFPLGIGLLITMSLLYTVRFAPLAPFSSYSYTHACVIGFVQGLALLPGISRLASTYVVGRWLKLSSAHALEVSWSLQAPLIMAAFIRGLLKVIASPYRHQLLNVRTVSVMIIAGVCAFYALSWVTCRAYNHTLWRFSYYMIIPMLLWYGGSF
jgi:undecaprenyl-diphosphatase